MGADVIEVREHTSGLVAGPGFFSTPAAVYHADPCPEPSLSSGVACTLLDETPRHAWAQHPRLGLVEDEDPRSRKADLGSVAHTLLTGEGRSVQVIEAEAYTTKAAREARDEAIEAGLTPVLRPDLLKAERMVDAVRARLSGMLGTDGAFLEGRGETAAIWQDPTGIWGRAMIDWWSPGQPVLWDLKTTSAGLSDRAIGTRIAEGWDLQAAWYCRGVEQLVPELRGRTRMLFVVVETAPPHECRVIALDGSARHVGHRRAVHAAALFADCLRRDRWPGYPAEVETIETPGWHATRWEARELYDPRFAGLAQPLARALSPFAPTLEAAE